MKKRIVSAVCAAAMAVSIVATPTVNRGIKLALAISASAEIYGEFEYEIKDGSVNITKYTGSATEVSIPETIDGKSVTSIGNGAFRYCTSLTSITIPDSVTTIGTSTFYGCTNLANITIPNSVKSIDDYAFFKCTVLKNVTIPDCVTRIGIGAFYGCTSLTSITMPSSVTYIGGNAFWGCTSLTSITLPNSVRRISGATFSGCTSLTSITIPYSVTWIEYSAFWDCFNLTDVYYSGIQKQWNAILIDDYNDLLLNATIHCTDGDIKPGTDDSSSQSDSNSQDDSSSQSDDSSAPDDSSKPDDSSTPDKPTPTPTPTPTKTPISKATVTVSNKTYTGKALKPAPTVTLGTKTLKKGTDYTVSYKNNTKCGKATVTVTGKGDYTGSKSASFIIKPKKVTAKKLTSPKTKQIKLTWTKASGGVTGYQVQIATNKTFTKGKKSVTVAKASATSKTVTKLKKGKKYYARVRAYKTVGKTKYYGAWSAVKNVKCK